MAKELDEWVVALDEWVDEDVPEAALQVQVAVLLEALRRLVQRTPVDTGRARGNWQVWPHTTDRLRVRENRFDPSGALSIRLGTRLITTVVRAYTVTWIANGLPYIVELEKGHSRQAPAGMVGLTYEELVTWLRSGVADA